MRICENGIPREYRADELEELERLRFEAMESSAAPTREDRIEAQALYTALMTDTILEEV